MLYFATFANTIYAFNWTLINKSILRNHLEIFQSHGETKMSIERNYKLRAENIIKEYLINLHQNYGTDTIMIRENVSSVNHNTKLYVWVKGREDETLAYFYYMTDFKNDLIVRKGNHLSNYITERIYDEWDLPLIKRIMQYKTAAFDIEDFCVLTRLIPDAESTYKIESMEYSFSE